MNRIRSPPREQRRTSRLISVAFPCFLQEEIELPEVPSEPLPEKKPGTPSFSPSGDSEFRNSAKWPGDRVVPIPWQLGELLAPGQAEHRAVFPRVWVTWEELNPVGRGVS